MISDPDVNAQIDFFGKASNAYVIYDKPDIFYGRFKRLNNSTVEYTNKGGKFFEYDTLQGFLIVRIRERVGIKKVHIPMGLMLRPAT